MKLRSRIMYSWNQKGARAARATSPMSHAETVERVKGMPAALAARTAWHSPRRALSPASPIGASATGSANCWPNNSVERSSVETSRRTRWRSAIAASSSTLLRSVTSA